MNRLIIFLEREVDGRGVEWPCPIESRHSKEELVALLMAAFEEWASSGKPVRSTKAYSLGDTGIKIREAEFCHDHRRPQFRPPEIWTVDEWFEQWANKRSW